MRAQDVLISLLKHGDLKRVVNITNSSYSSIAAKSRGEAKFTVKEILAVGAVVKADVKDIIAAATEIAVIDNYEVLIDVDPTDLEKVLRLIITGVLINGNSCPNDGVRPKSDLGRVGDICGSPKRAVESGASEHSVHVPSSTISFSCFSLPDAY